MTEIFSNQIYKMTNAYFRGFAIHARALGRKNSIKYLIPWHISWFLFETDTREK